MVADAMPSLFAGSLARGAQRNFCLRCNGALALYFRCLLGWMLAFHSGENVLFIAHHTIMFAIFAMPGHLSHASFAIAPLNMVPFGLPFSSLTMTAALSSYCILIPSGLRYDFFCLTMTASTVLFRMSGLPFLTDAQTRSPTPAAGFLPLTVLRPITVNTRILFAPELSQV